MLFVLALLQSYSVFANNETNDAIRQSTSSLDAQEVTADKSLFNLLEKMKHSVLNTDYQIYFVLEDDNSRDFSNTFRYRYLGSNEKKYAELLYLEGAQKEVILYNNIVSYFQPDSVSFSFPANRIIEAFPDIIYNDFNKLKKYYDFILVGNAKTANRNCKLVRIVPKEKDRYNYVLWLDENSYLPLRIDLLDLTSKIIGQMKVLALDSNFDITAFKHNIEHRDYPIFFPIDKDDDGLASWSVDWLPAGFEETSSYHVNYEKSIIKTKLFSDGIFSFSVNISPTDSVNKSATILEQGVRTIYSANIHSNNVVIIGNIPLETMERVANSIKNR